MAGTVTVPTKQQIMDVAFDNWVMRGCPVSSEADRNRDWKFAEDTLGEPWLKARIQPSSTRDEIHWHRWAKKNLLPYLAIEARANPNELIRVLTDAQNRVEKIRTSCLFLVTALDGGPEYSFSLYKAHQGNGIQDIKAVIDAKDARFYRFCYTSFCFHEGVLADQGCCSVETFGCWKSRFYQDGCAVAFPPTASLGDVLASSVRLRNALADYNTEKNLFWTEQLHLRISIGSSWHEAVHGLANAWRDKTVLGPAQWRMVKESGFRQLCLAAGIQPGPSGRLSETQQEEYDASKLSEFSPDLSRIP